MKRMIAPLGLVLVLSCAVAAFTQGRFAGFDTTAAGQGTLRQARYRDERITQIRVTLQRNGEAEIQIEGDMPALTFAGTWSEGLSDSVNLNINQGFGNARVSASGKLYLRRGEFDRLDIEGRTNGERFAIGFTARRIISSHRPDSPDTSPGGRNYSVEAARRALEDQIFRERRERVEVVFDRADTYFISSSEEGVRGTGRVRIGGEWQLIRFDSAVDTRQGRVTRVTYDLEPRDSGAGIPGGPVTSFRAGRYEIQLVNTGRLLAVGRDGVTVQQTSSSEQRARQWDFEPAGGSFYYIRNAETGGVMTVEGSGGNGSSVIVAQQLRDRDNQLWEVRSGPDGGFYILAKSGKALDSPSSARFEGGRMQVYNANGEANQRFRLRAVEYRDDQSYDPRPGGGGRSGSLRWRGRVDDVVRLEVRGAAISERLISGTPFNNGRFTFTSPLPRREVSLSLDRRKSRGSIEIIERPTSYNNYTAVIEIRDPQGGAADYEFDLRWN